MGNLQPISLSVFLGMHPFPVTHRRHEGMGQRGRQRIFFTGGMQKCFLQPSGNLPGCSSSLLWKHGRATKKICQPHSVCTVLDKVGKKNGVQERDLFFNNVFVFLDINECLLHPNICGTAICKNTQGRYECECPEGYTYNSTSKNCEGGSLPPAHPFSSLYLPLPLFLIHCHTKLLIYCCIS